MKQMQKRNEIPWGVSSLCEVSIINEGWDVLMISEQDKMMDPRRMSFKKLEADILNIKCKKVKLFPRRLFYQKIIYYYISLSSNKIN